MAQDEEVLHYEAGHYELRGYPLRPGDVVEVWTGSGWLPGYIAFERQWYWVGPGGHMVSLSEGLTARFPRHYLAEGWESEDSYDNEFLIEKWDKGELSVEAGSMPPRAPNGLVILARDARGKILIRIRGTRTANKLQGAMTTAREILQTTPGAASAEVHLFEGYASRYTSKPLAVFSHEDVTSAEDEEEEEL